MDWKKILDDKGIIKIIVRTNSPKTEIVEYEGDIFRVNVKAVPEKGKANMEVVKYFSKLTKKDVRITSGLKSKRKTLRLS